MTSDEACKFSVWWIHNRKALISPRQAALAAWEEATKPAVSVNRYCRAGMCVSTDAKHEPGCAAHRDPPNGRLSRDQRR